MVAWLIYRRESAEHNKQYIQLYIDEGKKLNIEVKLLLVEELEFGVRNQVWFVTHNQVELRKPDFAICRAIYPLLSRQLELMGIPVFNNSKVSEICNDKARTYQYLAGTGIRMIASCFYRNEQVAEVLAQISAPTVIKAVDGHGGSQVFLAGGENSGIAGNSGSISYSASMDSHLDTTNKPELAGNRGTTENLEIIKGIGDSDVVVQPLTGSRHQDLRVYVIGREIIAGILRTAKEGFKANFSLGGDVGLYRLSREETELVDRITGMFDFGLVGIDFIIGDDGELIFNEIEDVVGSRMLYQCTDINVVERYLKYILRKLDTTPPAFFEYHQ